MESFFFFTQKLISNREVSVANLERESIMWDHLDRIRGMWLTGGIERDFANEEKKNSGIENHPLVTMPLQDYLNAM